MVSVWNIDLLQPISVVDALRGWLDDDEVHAAATRRADVLRHRYVVAHGAARAILGARLGIDPGAVILSRRCEQCGDPRHGKPVLADHPDLWFNLSHTESFAMLAVAAGAGVGFYYVFERPSAGLDRLAARVL
jgi:4'-phosphopantetheinyl transferase